ncbi:hypothetical protein M8C21_024269 [Ambrosia artemisiifolia]|uniref:F-box domain-containing protein n=1 Tax=Ambrosia artemisiifolia TaxID=4212 RepID=A0AAD5CF62_AMBAR|nr:hypothetical protein M8C21_024269 [Ambrosia artemisiifolia]
MGSRCDQLSGLPDELIHKILSFVDIKQAIKTTTLSSRWSSRSLKHLTLTRCIYKHPITATPTCELPTLTTLNLHRVTFYDDSTTDKCSGLFSNFANLKNITLKDCHMEGSKDFDIRHPKLSNLTLEDGCQGVNVATPQLKNLTIRYWQKMFMISAPNLASFHYKDCYANLQLSADLLHLEKADIWISHPSLDKENAHKIVRLLQQLRSVKFLTLNLEIIELLTSSSVLVSHQPSPFANLKSLHIYPAYATKVVTQPQVTMSAEVKSYLLDGSPGATFTLVSHEEIRARTLMRELQLQLKQWEKNSETNTIDMKQDKSAMESHMATLPEQVEVEHQLDTNMKRQFWERMTHINKQFKKEHKNIRYTISLLRKIEGVLEKLPPTSYRAKLQVSFSSLRAEVDASMDVMVDRLKIQCDKKPRLLS